MNFFSSKKKNNGKNEEFRPQSHQTKKFSRTIVRNSWEVRPTSSANIQRNIYEKWEKFLHMPQLRISSSNKKIKNQKSINQNTNSKVNQYINNFLQTILNNNNESKTQNLKSKTQSQFFKIQGTVIKEENNNKIINQDSKFQSKVANFVYPIGLSNHNNFHSGNIRNFTDLNNKLSINSQTEQKNIQNDNKDPNKRVKLKTILFDGNMLENNFKLNNELNKFPIMRLFTANNIRKNNYFLNKKEEKKFEVINNNKEKSKILISQPIPKESINKTAKTEEGTNNISKNIEHLKSGKEGQISK